MRFFWHAISQLILDYSPQLLSFVAGFTAAVFAEPVRRRIYRPKVKLQFGSSEDFITPTEEQDGSLKYQARYVRVMTSNCSSYLARGCRVFLTSIERETKRGQFERTRYCDSIQLSWSVRGEQAFSSIDLPRGLTQFVDVISTTERASAVRVHLQAMPIRYENIFSQPGTYRLTLRILGEEIVPDEIRLVFQWAGQWNSFAVQAVA